ncbi:MAG: triose-phosphate isomerase [Bacteroidota bacterium]|nr:triose-phosphate isomerase [Bacteroidota bacterium]
MRKQIAAANWKMNCTWPEAKQLLDDLLSQEFTLGEGREVILAVPFPYLMMAAEKIEKLKGFRLAAQNCYSKPSGAYTGEVGIPMLQSIGVTEVIVGHSERREIFGEDNQLLADKINICLDYSIRPIFCCGEPLQIRETGAQEAYVTEQIHESLFHLNESQVKNIVIAYEPIWAIGTGKTASADQAQEMHLHIRGVIAEKYGKQVADGISILYGGSVKAGNSREIFSKPDVDGGLVGGASLVAADFTTIIKSLK